MFLKVVVNQKYLGQDVKNILCWTGSDATIANGQVFADQLRDIYLDELSTQMSPKWSMESVTLYDAAAPAGTPGVTFVPALGSIVGVGGSNTNATQIAGLLRFYSTVGPPWQGGMYFSGMTVGVMGDDGRFNQIFVDSMAAFGGRLQTFSVDAGLTVFHSIISDGGNAPIEDRTAIVTSYLARNNPSTQRRRKQGVGS